MPVRITHLRVLTIILSTFLFAFWPPLAELDTKTSSQSASAHPSAAQGLKLNPDDEVLFRESKQAVLTAGISEPYFAKHFQLVKVINKEGDRRVVWRFRVNGFEATVDDSIGYYTAAGKRVNVHSVENLLRPAHDIVRTISRTRARAMMRACIGKFESDYVSYQGSPKGALLLLNAQAQVNERKSDLKPRDRERERAAKGQITRKADDEIPPAVVGTLNLETGKCIKGLVISP